MRNLCGISMKIYIGWDWREDDAWHACAHSLRVHSGVPLDIEPISSKHPLMNRAFYYKGNQKHDVVDERPFSTEFSFARFLVPVLEGYKGWAMFVDCDFLFRRDVGELFKLRDDTKAVMVVQQDHVPREPTKMMGAAQSSYRRKNWSSLVLWNCAHRAHRLMGQFRGIDAEKVNTAHGGWLHGFDWLKMEDIGNLPSEWNWLEGYSSPEADPAAVHYTRGGPWLDQYKDAAYAEEWRAAHLRSLGVDTEK